VHGTWYVQHSDVQLRTLPVTALMACAACARHVKDRKPKPFILPASFFGMSALQTKPTGCSSCRSSVSVTPNGRLRTMMRHFLTCRCMHSRLVSLHPCCGSSCAPTCQGSQQ
jgi:hypothetical protein